MCGHTFSQNIISSIGTISKSFPRSSEGNYERKASKENQKDFKHSSRQSQNAVYVLTEFALDIMKTLENFNNDNFKSEGMLRIGEYTLLYAYVYAYANEFFVLFFR